MSTFKECTDYANRIKTCYLATNEGDQPRVRPLGMWYAAEDGFWFQSQSVKALIKQIEKNPKCEFCFFGEDKVLRVNGLAKIVKDKDVLAKCIEERRHIVEPFGITDPSNPLLAVFHVYTGECYFWTGAFSMKEAQIPRIKF